MWTAKLLVLGALFITLSGCAGMQSKQVVTKSEIDPMTGNEIKTMTETSPSFFKSENQEMAFNVMEKRISAQERTAIQQLQAINSNAERRMHMNLSPEAMAYANALDTVIISQVKTTVPLNDIPMPRNMADVMERNVIPLTQMAIGLTGELFGLDIPSYLTGGFGGAGSGNQFDTVDVGGDFYFMSTRRDQYDLDAYAAWQDQRNGTISKDYDTNTDSGNSLSFGDSGSYGRQTSNNESFF